MRKHSLSYKLLVALFGLGLLSAPFFLSSTQFVHRASARTWESETNLTVPAMDFEALELMFYEGQELELIFTMSVKQELPVDLWFVNDYNYALLLAGEQFLYFIDGSELNVTQALKIVLLTQYDTYKLVFANYNDEPVDITLKYDINILDITPPSSPTQVAIESKGENEITIGWQANTEPDLEGYIIQCSTSSDGPFTNATMLEKDSISYTDYGLDPGKTYYYRIMAIDSSENPSEPSDVISAKTKEATTTEEAPLWQSAIFLAPITLVIGILIGLFASRISSNKAEKKVTKKKPRKKVKRHKAKKKKPVETEKGSSKKLKKRKVKTKPETPKKEPEVIKKTSAPSFCGYCGKPVDTPFCVHCGKAVESPTVPMEEGTSET